MFSMNDKMISKKPERGALMDTITREDIRKVALNFNKIYKLSPESYYYIKGFIHCLLQKAELSKHETKTG